MSDRDTKFFETLAENLESSVRFVDTEKRILYINPYGERLLGHSMTEVVGKQCADFSPRHTDATGVSLCETECLLDWSLKKGKIYEGRNFFRDKKNNTFPVEIRVLPVSNSKGEVIGVVEIMRDDRPRLELEELRRDIQRMIPVDLLTGLYTRHKIMEYFEVKVENAVRYGSPLGILNVTVCDLDSIKKEFGGKKAEEVMQRVGYLFRMNMRRGDISGRLGPGQTAGSSAEYQGRGNPRGLGKDEAGYRGRFNTSSSRNGYESRSAPHNTSRTIPWRPSSIGPKRTWKRIKARRNAPRAKATVAAGLLCVGNCLRRPQAEAKPYDPV